LHWPDFDSAALGKALSWYAQRVRRFGRTDEQVLNPPPDGHYPSPELVIKKDLKIG